jgi:hypothetical protein
LIARSYFSNLIFSKENALYANPGISWGRGREMVVTEFFTNNLHGVGYSLEKLVCSYSSGKKLPALMEHEDSLPFTKTRLS